MTQLLHRLHDELVRRHDATTTRESYLRIVKAFHRHAGGRLDRVGPDDLRRVAPRQDPRASARA